LQATLPQLTRSALHRCFQRHGISRLPELDGVRPAQKKKFKKYPIGYLHIDLTEVRTEEGKLYLFVAVDRTSKFAFTQLVERANVVTASAFLDALVEAIPYRLHTCSPIMAFSSPICPRTGKVPPPCFAAILSTGPAAVTALSTASPNPTIPGPMVRSSA
jgi:hypothetical protein